MNIGVLTSVHSPFDVRIFHKECRSLAAAGHAVTVIAPHAQQEFVHGVTIRGVPGARTRLGRATATVSRIYAEAVRLDADVYHLHDPELLSIGLLLARRGKRVVYDAHEDLPRTITSKSYLPRPTRGPISVLSDALERIVGRRLSAIVVATPGLVARFSRINPCTVMVRNYVVLSEWPLSTQVPWGDRAPWVAYVGAITWDRGLREMVDAIRQVHIPPRARLVLAGSYSPMSLRYAARNLPGWDRVQDLGVLSRPGVAELLGQVQAGLVALHTTPAYVSSLPIKLFEYMAAGLPCIASDFPLMRQVVQQARCGILVDATDAGAIAAATSFLLTHPTDAQEMGRRGRDAAEASYSWDKEAHKLIELYAALERGRTANPVRAG